MEITEEQLIAARGILKWSQKDLARILGISPTQICEYERGLRMSGKRMSEVVCALESAGVVFLDTPQGRGLILRKNTNQNRAQEFET